MYITKNKHLSSSGLMLDKKLTVTIFFGNFQPS